MNRVWVWVALAAALVFGGMFVVAIFVRDISTNADSNSSYAKYSRHGVVYGNGPEWDKLWEYESQGSEGWAGLEGMMSSTDSNLAREAANHLAITGGRATDHFLRGLRSIDTSAKNYIGMDDFNDEVWQRALQAVRDQEEDMLEGAAYFLRMEHRDFNSTSVTEGEVGDVLVASIPDATGAYADALPQTLSYYRPDDLDALTYLLRSEDAGARLIAVRSLGKFGLEETLDDVQRLKKDSDVDVREAAYGAEGSITNAVARAVARAAYVAEIEISESGLAAATVRENAKKRLGMP